MGEVKTHLSKDRGTLNIFIECTPDTELLEKLIIRKVKRCGMPVVRPLPKKGLGGM